MAKGAMNMQINFNDRTVEIDGDTYDLVKREPEWPQDGDTAFRVNDYASESIVLAFNSSGDFDLCKLKRGELYRTQEECEHADAYKILVTRWMNFNKKEWAKVGGIDWCNDGQEKYSCQLTHTGTTILSGFMSITDSQTQHSNMYTPCIDKAREAFTKDELELIATGGEYHG